MPRGRPPTTYRSPCSGGRELRARVTADEYARVCAAADARGISVPELVRLIVLAGVA